MSQPIFQFRAAHALSQHDFDALGVCDKKRLNRLVDYIERQLGEVTFIQLLNQYPFMTPHKVICLTPCESVDDPCVVDKDNLYRFIHHATQANRTTPDPTQSPNDVVLFPVRLRLPKPGED